MIIKAFCLRRRFFFDETGGFKDGEKGNHKSKVKSPPMAGDSHQTIEAFLGGTGHTGNLSLFETSNKMGKKESANNLLYIQNVKVKLIFY